MQYHGAYAPSCQLSCVHDGHHVSCLHFVCIRQGQLHGQSQVYRSLLHAVNRRTDTGKINIYSTGILICKVTLLPPRQVTRSGLSWQNPVRCSLPIKWGCALTHALRYHGGNGEFYRPYPISGDILVWSISSSLVSHRTLALRARGRRYKTEGMVTRGIAGGCYRNLMVVSG